MKDPYIKDHLLSTVGSISVQANTRCLYVHIGQHFGRRIDKNDKHGDQTFLMDRVCYDDALSYWLL